MPTGDEEEAREDVSEGDDVAHGLVAVLGLGNDEARRKARRRAKAPRLVSPATASPIINDREQEEFAAARPGDQ
jgi:hypothetical protein